MNISIKKDRESVCVICKKTFEKKVNNQITCGGEKCKRELHNQLLTELAGSLSMPEKWKGKDINAIVQDVKAQHFQNKKV